MLLRGLILAFTGDQATTVLDEDPNEIERGVATVAMQALDRQTGSGWHGSLVPSVVQMVVDCVCFQADLRP